VNVSHDGARLAVTTIDKEVHTAAIDGSGSAPLVAGDQEANDPEWSPDDAWILYDFPAASELRSELYVVRTDGSKRARLTNLGYACCADWSLTTSSVGD
jgi:Tol biopolymer transport system component